MSGDVLSPRIQLGTVAAILMLLIFRVPATAAPGDTMLATRADGAGGAPLQGSDLSLSAGGRLVAFVTSDVDTHESQVLVRDMATGRTLRREPRSRSGRRARH